MMRSRGNGVLSLFLIVLFIVLKESETVRWHRSVSRERLEDRTFFQRHGDIKSPEDLFNPEYAKDAKMGYARGGATSLRNLEHPPSRKIKKKKTRLPEKSSLRFKERNQFPPEPTPEEQWVLSYSQMASVYGRGVKDLSVPFYGTFGNHNYGPMGMPYAKIGDPRLQHTKHLPWNYSAPWEHGPHPIWPVPPTAQNSSQYNPHAIDWMTRKNYDFQDSIQPIGAGDRAAKPMMPLPGPKMELRTGGYGMGIDEYLRERGPSPNYAPGVPFSPPDASSSSAPPAEFLRFKTSRKSRLSGMESGSESSHMPNAPSVIFDPKDTTGTLYINASSHLANFPFDQTGNMASAPYTGFPSQWSHAPYPYGPAGEMPGTSGHPEPYSKWFWMRGEIPRTYPGYSSGRGYFLHGGAFHPHLPVRSMNERMSLWPGNVGLMTSDPRSTVPGVIAMRAAAMRPPTTGEDSHHLGYTVGGDLQGMQDHYNSVPVAPIPPPEMAGSQSFTADTGSPNLS
jgi:hypothetical protein